MGPQARKTVRACRSGALATMDRDSGMPYVSLCATTSDYAGHPLFLLSDLADHTKNIAKNPQVSLLCEQASHLSNPQAGPRVSLVGQMEKITDREICTIFLQAHPSAKMYAQFEDFNFYRLNVEKAHYVGGFGKAVWVEAAHYLSDSAASLTFCEEQPQLITTLNTDFPQFAHICATKLLKQRGKNWQVLRVDCDGVDLRLASKTIRYPFENEVKSLDEILQIIAGICG